jgi:hypothetical protein
MMKGLGGGLSWPEIGSVKIGHWRHSHAVIRIEGRIFGFDWSQLRRGEAAGLTQS